MQVLEALQINYGHLAHIFAINMYVIFALESVQWGNHAC